MTLLQNNVPVFDKIHFTLTTRTEEDFSLSSVSVMIKATQDSFQSSSSTPPHIIAYYYINNVNKKKPQKMSLHVIVFIF